jgi:hypothetical protein
MVIYSFDKLRIFIQNEERFQISLQAGQDLIDHLFTCQWLKHSDFTALFSAYEDLTLFHTSFLQQLNSGKKIDNDIQLFEKAWVNYLAQLPNAVSVARTFSRNKMMENILRPLTSSRPAWLHLISMLDVPRQHFERLPKRIAKLLNESPELSEFIVHLHNFDKQITHTQKILHHQTTTNHLVSKLNLDVPKSL